MREKLKERDGKRGSWTATFKRYGRKTGWKGREETTCLFVDVRDAQGNDVCDHIWFTCGTTLAALGLRPGDRVGFDGRITHYWKGYGAPEEQELDYRLSFPTKWRILTETQSPVADLPLFGFNSTAQSLSATPA